eukprot:m51a1_g4400 hypothetical protein (1674) ;mRNA; f:391768-411511
MKSNIFWGCVAGDFSDPVWAVLLGGPDRRARQEFRRHARAGTPAHALPSVDLLLRFAADCNAGADGEARAVQALASGRLSLRLAENPVFFPAYGPVLRSISVLSHTDVLPFKDSFVRCQRAQPSAMAAVIGEKLRKLAAEQPEVFGTLDPAQREAYEHFAASPLALVQGPPGTGKSYLAARIIYALVRECEGPVLVMSYKNHSLDEILLDAIALLGPELGERVVRLGGNKKMSPALATHTKQAAVQRAKTENTVPGRLARKLRETLDEAKQCAVEVRQYVQALSAPVSPSWDAWQRLGIDMKALFGTEVTFLHWANLPFAQIRRELLAAQQKAYRVEQQQKGRKAEPSEDSQGEFEEENREREEKEEELMADAGAFAAGGLSLRGHVEVPADSLATFAAMHMPPTEELNAPAAPPRSFKDSCELVRGVLHAQHAKLVNEYLAALERLKEAQLPAQAAVDERDGLVLAHTRVIGGTVTGCAIQQSTIAAARPRYLVVEEAAEIPEAALVASLFPSLERVVMIGDHKQLRASVACHELKVRKHLDVSAFERLLNNGLPSVQLRTQNRMMPTVLAPVLMHYPTLDSNLDIVGALEAPQWLQHPLFWWDHTSPESHEISGRSVANAFEADRTCALVKFMLRQGFPPQRVTVLVPYAGQMLLLRNRFHIQADQHLGLCEVRVCTVDEYQGDENHLVVLSTVRSGGKSLGFLKEVNRQIVATSRHKVALVIVGNAEHLSSAPHWKRLRDALAADGCVSAELPLCCPRHEGHVIRMDVCSGSAAGAVRGCGAKCGAVLECGHLCEADCHGPIYAHRDCSKTMTKTFPCGHEVTYRCFEQRDACTENVVHTFPCGHSQSVRCCDVGRAKCTKRCERKLSCGHPCLLSCGTPCDSRTCRHCLNELSSGIVITPFVFKSPQPSPSPSSPSKMPSQRDAVTNGSLSLVETKLLVAEAKTVEPEGGLSDEEWARVVSLLRASDMGAAPLDPTSADDLADAIRTSESTERVISILLRELNIKVPRKWSQLPMVWVFLALRDLCVPGTLGVVRSALAAVCSDRTPKVDEKVPSMIIDALREATVALCSCFRTNCWAAYQRFKDEHIATVAERLTIATGADALLDITKRAVKLGERWGCTLNGGVKLPPRRIVHKKGLYCSANVGKCFVSVDLRAADFATLMLADRKLVLCATTWAEFVHEASLVTAHSHPFTPMPGIEAFKALRTRVLGMLCHQKNAALQGHVLCLLARAVAVFCAEEEGSSHITKVFRFSCDELLLEVDRPENLEGAAQRVSRAVKAMLPKLSEHVRVEAFVLRTRDVDPADEPLLLEEDAEKIVMTQYEEEILRSGHAAMRGPRHVDEKFYMDAEWADTSPSPKKSSSYYVRELHDKVGVVSQVPKCLPRSLLGKVFCELARSYLPGSAVESETVAQEQSQEKPCGVGTASQQQEVSKSADHPAPQYSIGGLSFDSPTDVTKHCKSLLSKYKTAGGVGVVVSEEDKKFLIDLINQGHPAPDTKLRTALAVLAMPAIGVGLVLHPEHACDCFALLFTYAVDAPNALCAAVEVVCSLFCLAAVISAQTTVFSLLALATVVMALLAQSPKDQCDLFAPAVAYTTGVPNVAYAVADQLYERLVVAEGDDVNDTQHAAVSGAIAKADRCLRDGVDEYQHVLAVGSRVMRQLCSASCPPGA